MCLCPCAGADALVVHEASTRIILGHPPESRQKYVRIYCISSLLCSVCSMFLKGRDSSVPRCPALPTLTTLEQSIRSICPQQRQPGGFQVVDCGSGKNVTAVNSARARRVTSTSPPWLSLQRRVVRCFERREDCESLIQLEADHFDSKMGLQ